MKGNLQRRYTMQRLHIFPDENVPQEIIENVSNQIKQMRAVPKRLDTYTEEERDKFPKIMDYPKDYILRQDLKSFIMYRFFKLILFNKL